jgi:FixJ family two-component response regulator
MNEQFEVAMPKKAIVSLVGIVDDDESVRESISSLLRSAGYKTAIFESAEAFLNSSRFREPDCLLFDIRMPGLSGLELQSQLQDMKCMTPVIFVTAHTRDDLRAQALQRGAVAFLDKPVNDEALFSALESTKGIPES